MPYELMYSSFCPKPMGVKDLSILLREARENNQDTGITGVLAYHSNTFIQLLEGEQDSVYGLYAKIAEDPRHTVIRTIWEADIDKISFPDWAMGFCHSGNYNQQQLDIIGMECNDYIESLKGKKNSTNAFTLFGREFNSQVQQLG